MAQDSVLSPARPHGTGARNRILAGRLAHRWQWVREITVDTCGRYDDRVKRLTVSLPDELVERIKAAAGGEGRVSAYVAGALTDYQERTSLDDVLAAWQQETPVPGEMRRQASAELDDVGLTGPAEQDRRRAG